MPLVIGTAQLGTDYGIANRTGKPGPEEAIDIVRTAWQKGIRYFDTAQVYGDSEKVLGSCFRSLELTGESDLSINTKLDPSLNLRDWRSVASRVNRSLEDLGIQKLWGLMLHREALLSEHRPLLKDLVQRLKEEEKTKYMGVSVYSAEKALLALDMDEFDMVQVPFNLFDQRAMEMGVFTAALERRKLMLVRSVYLQGLLLLDPDQIPEILSAARSPLKALRDAAEGLGVSPQALCLAFVLRNAPNALIIIGVETAQQVMENVTFYQDAISCKLPDLNPLAQQNPRLINPSAWAA